MNELQTSNHGDGPVGLIGVNGAPLAGSTQRPHGTSPPAILPQIPTAMAILVAIVYVVGVMAVNIHLHDLGVSDFSLVKARYVYTGVLALGYIGVAVVPPLIGLALLTFIPWVRRVALNDRPLPRSVRCLGHKGPAWLSRSSLVSVAAVFFFVILLALPWIAFWWLLPGLLKYHETRTEAAALYFKGFLAGLAGVIFAFVADRVKHYAVRRAAFITSAGVLFLVLFGLPLWLFSTQILPQIPEEFGGGKPKLVQLLIAQGESMDDVQQLGLSPVPSSRVTLPVQVLFEGDDTYTLGIPKDYQEALGQPVLTELRIRVDPKNRPSVKNDRVVQIQRQLVQAIVVIRGFELDALGGVPAGTPAIDASGSYIETITAKYDSCTHPHYRLKHQQESGIDAIIISLLGQRPADATCHDVTDRPVRVNLGMLSPGSYLLRMDVEPAIPDQPFDIPPPQ